MMLRVNARERRYICDMVLYYFAKAELAINNGIPNLYNYANVCFTYGNLMPADVHIDSFTFSQVCLE